MQAVKVESSDQHIHVSYNGDVMRNELIVNTHVYYLRIPRVCLFG